MKPPIKVATCMFFVIALLTASCISTRVTVNKSVVPENELIGVWRHAKLVEADLDLPGMANGEPDAYIIFTERYRFVVGSRNPNRQELPESPTDSQLVAAWAPVWAFAFTYEVKGDTVIEHLLFSKNPNEKRGEQGSHTFKFDGDDLLWTVKVNGGANTVTSRYKRIE